MQGIIDWETKRLGDEETERLRRLLLLRLLADTEDGGETGAWCRMQGELYGSPPGRGVGWVQL